MNKKNWFKGIMGAVLISAVPFWFFFVTPHLFKLQKDFTYEAEVVSSDNFYDQEKGAFSGESISVTKFSYSVVKEQEGVLIIKNIFDVRKLTGEPIFSVERLYGIDPITRKHVAGFGDKNRDGYLFAPKGLKKGEPFTYWHINYDSPAHMRFVGEEIINDLTVYRYQTRYEGMNIDQTKNLGFLPEVGVTRGINLDPYLQLWIEPQTGTLINYKDETTAYYYDLETGKRLYPWNKFSNTFKQSSITTQVEIAKQNKLFIFVINLGVLIAIILIAFITILVLSLRNLNTAKKDVVKNLKKLEENQIKLQEEQVKSKDTANIAFFQNVQLEKTKKAMLNLLGDLNIEKVELIKAKIKDEAIISSIGDGFFAVDKEGKIIMFNQQAESMLGFTLNEVVGKKYNDILEVQDANGVVVPMSERPIERALSEKKKVTTTTTTTTTTYFYVRKDKTKFPAAITVTPIILDGEVIGGIDIFRDISKEKEIDKAKSEFVSLASHQLRTPPTNMKWFLEMILSGEVGQLNKKQKEYLDEVYHNNQRMISLINTLLNVSRIELGVFKVIPEPTNIINLVKDIFKEYELQIQIKNLSIKEVHALDLPLMLVDPKFLRIILQNIISNAVKYTPANGKITVEISSKQKGEDIRNRKIQKNSLVIIVSDTGYGIPKNQYDRVFTKLFRADNITEKDTDGTGLGLYLTKSIVDHAQGDLWFESELNKGTTFYLVIPNEGVWRQEGEKELVVGPVD